MWLVCRFLVGGVLRRLLDSLLFKGATRYDRG